MDEQLAYTAFVGGVVLLILLWVFGRRVVYIIRQHELGIVERTGKYVGAPRKPGIHFKRPIFDRLVARLDLRLRNIEITVDGRTQGDGARVRAFTFIEFQVDPNMAYEAHYNLADPVGRLRARANEIAQLKLYTMTLEQALESNTQIADAILEQLTSYAAEHGYQITNVVVTHVEPEASVLNAMSEQAALARRNEIAKTEADAENRRQLAAAETSAAVSRLEGEASASQQTATFDAIQAAAKKLADEQGIDFATALRYMIQIFEVAATRDAVSYAGNSIVTVGTNTDLVNAVTAGTQAGNRPVKDN